MSESLFKKHLKAEDKKAVLRQQITQTMKLLDDYFFDFENGQSSREYYEGYKALKKLINVIDNKAEDIYGETYDLD